MDMIEELNEYVNSYNCNESLSARVRMAIPKSLKSGGVNKKHFIVTDLCNPCCALAPLFHKKISKSPSLSRKLLRGKHLHKIAGYWFREMEGFVIDEGMIDGAWVGIDDVRGAIDYLIDDSIFELKTKPSLPESIEEIFKLYPNDLEQLVFYSAMHPLHPEVNYLVFMEDKSPHNLSVYKVTIKNAHKIKNILVNRINKFKESIEKKIPLTLGRCRYHDSGCPYCDAGLCSCDEQEDVPLEDLKSSIEIVYDEGLSKELESCKKKSQISSSIFTTKDIIAPREHYKEYVEGVESNWIPDKEKEGFWLCMNDLIKSLPVELSRKEKSIVADSLVDNRLRVGFRWLKLRSSTKPEGVIAPYLVKVSSAKNIKFASKPHEYHLAEMAIVTSAYKVDRGLIFMIYPHLNNLIKVYEVTYKNTKKATERIVELMDLIEESEEKKDIGKLPDTPSFMLNS